jgi:hypothetical protein
MPRNPLKALLSTQMGGKLTLRAGGIRTAVLPSAQRTTEDVQAALEDLLKDSRICSIRVEDFLVHSAHHCLFPLLKEVVMSRKKWNRFEFVDTMELPKYEAWSDLQIDTQQEYEMSCYVHHNNNYLQEISWVAQVKLVKGTPVKDILAFLQRLLMDSDIYQATVTGFTDSAAPGVLQSFVNTKTEQLENAVMIRVAWSWWKRDVTEWRVMVAACYKALAATVLHPAMEFHQVETFDAMKTKNSLNSVAA